MGFAKYPDMRWRPLGQQGEPSMTAHDLIIVHTMVGYLYSTDVMFRQGGYDGTESHYGIGGPWGADASRDLDGVVYGWQDLGHGADANLEANRVAISIETADNAPARAADIRPWSPRQAESLARLIAWLCSVETHAGCPTSWTCHANGIPLALVPDSKPGRRGVAYHRQGIDPWRVSGGQRWSTSRGKECPGTVRIRQLSEEIIPRARQIQNGGDMPLDEKDVDLLLDSKASDIIPHEALDKDPTTGKYPPTDPANPNRAPKSNLAETNRVARQNRRSLLKLETQVGELQGDVADLRTLLASLTGTVDLNAVRAAILEAGTTAADGVRAAGAEVLQQLDAVRLDINRG